MVQTLIEGRQRDIGGFCVRRVLPSPKQRMVGPFIFFDEMGPSPFAPGQGLEVRSHPHIGLATLTYLFEGRIVHRDTTPVEQTITPGAVNLMLAGGGVVHSERSHTDDIAGGHSLHGLQLWLALPREQEGGPAHFHHIPAADLPTLEGRAISGRVVLGEAFGLTGSTAFPWPALFVDLSLAAGTHCPLPEAAERGLFVVEGAINLEGETVPAGTMAILPAGPVTITAEAKTRLALVGGAPMDGARHIDWNFVASDPTSIERAKADWQAAAENGFSGRFRLPAGETDHIPLPGAPPAEQGGAPDPVIECPTT